MEVRFIDGQGVRRCDPDNVVELFSHDDGFYRIDVPAWNDEAETLLTGLGCHAPVVEGCRQRNHVPMVHGYEDQVFVTTQSPYLGHAGHVHLLELDQNCPTPSPRPSRAGSGPVLLILNVLWLVLCGFWMAVGYALAGIALCVTIIGIPLGIASFKLIPVSLTPLGYRIVDSRSATW